MRGIKIPQYEFAQGGAYARGGAYLRDTTVVFFNISVNGTPLGPRCLAKYFLQYTII